jgi:hypothetical protein
MHSHDSEIPNLRSQTQLHAEDSIVFRGQAGSWGGLANHETDRVDSMETRQGPGQSTAAGRGESSESRNEGQGIEPQYGDRFVNGCLADSDDKKVDRLSDTFMVSGKW